MPSSHGTQLLKPNKILHYVIDSEEKQWTRLDISQGSDGQSSSETVDTGTAILRHGKTVRKIHKYFGNLEPRKCCLYLTSCKTTFSNVRLVRNDGRDSGIEEGAMMKTPVDHSVKVNELDENDFRVFKFAYMCASLPVLGAPEPPPVMSPSPVYTPTEKGKVFHFSGVFHHPPSPSSLQDSGVEDDTSIVPAESLRELLMRTFRLTPERFYYYEQKIANMYGNKQTEKILAEELVGQLSALENNNNPFYSPDTFMHTQGYDRWQRHEFSQIGELMKKFWHMTYPPPSNQYVRYLQNVHTDYKILMEKLIRYESPYRLEGELLAPGPTSPLSTTSVRLLKEFGLRYGIGEIFKKIVYLNYLVNHFDTTVWYIQHTGAVLTSLMDMLPKKGAHTVLVKKEYTILGESLQTLETQVISTFSKMRSVFPNNKPADGLEFLVDLASRNLQAKSFLSTQRSETLKTFLLRHVQNIFPTSYNKDKMVVMTDLSQAHQNSDLSPTLLNMMIGKIRDEVNDYKINFHSTFDKYFHVTCEAAQSLYRLLMEDVKLLCGKRQNEYASLQIDKLMLGLGYRLNQLDQEWSSYITRDMQCWRDLFTKEEIHWSIVLKVNLTSMVVNSVSIDDYNKDKVPVVENVWSTSSQGSYTTERVRTVSTKSFTPSMNSAFSGLGSSAHSTPVHPKQPTCHSVSSIGSMQYPTIPESDQAPPPQQRKKSGNRSKSFVNSERVHNYHDYSTHRRRGGNRPQHEYDFDTKSMEDYLCCQDDEELVSFTCIRHSSSMPDVLSKSYDHNLQVSRFNDPNKRNSESDHGSFEAFVDHEKDMRDFLSTQGRRLYSEGSDKDSLAEEFSASASDTLTDPIDNQREEDLTDHSESPEGFSFPPIEIVSMDNKLMESTVMPISSEHNSVPKPADTKTSKPQGSVVKPKPSTDRIAESYNQMKLASSRRLQIPSTSESSGGSPVQPKNNTLPMPGRVTISPPSYNFEIPISSSLVELIVMMQRLVGFSRTVCQTFCQIDPPSFESLSEESFLESGSVEDDSYVPMAETRQKLYDNFFEGMSSTLCVYADNMLCMDLCGTTVSVARKLAGQQLVEYLQTQREGGHVWGCRHDTKAIKDCFFYVDRQTDFLCDRYEPISRDMCTRINNVYSILEYLETFHSSLGKAFDVYSDWSVQRKRRVQLVTSSNEYEVLEGFSYNPESDRQIVMETVSQITDTTMSSHSSNSVIVQSPTKPCYDHIMCVLRALSRIMAYRINLFVYDALRLLLGLKYSEDSVQECLLPLTQFLNRYIVSLQLWLYPDCFRRVVECLWIFIVQDFEEEVSRLITQDNTESKARILIQALAHLLKFITMQDENIRKDQLLSQAEVVMFKLQLYTETTSQLITLFKGLQKHYMFRDSSSICSMDGAVQDLLHRMRTSLQRCSKCFSGRDLMEWIMSNPKLFINLWSEQQLTVDDIRQERQNCYAIAQWLLDQGLIVDMMNEAQSTYDSSILYQSYDDDDNTRYPDLTIQSNLQGPGSIDSDDDTPKVTPQATPRNSPLSMKHSSRYSNSRTSRLLSKTASRKSTPLPKFSISGTSKVGDISFYSISSGMSEINLEGAVGTTAEQTNVDGAPDVDGDDPIKRVPDSKSVGSRAAMSNRRDLFTPHLDSMLTNILFQDTEYYFYHIATLSDSNIHNTGHNSSRDTFELNTLIEQCFQTKISPDYILTLLYTRRKQDSVARVFTNRMTDYSAETLQANQQSACVTS